MLKLYFIAIIFIGITVGVSVQAFSEGTEQDERVEIYRRYYDLPVALKGGRVEPHWMADGNTFWYAEGAPENTVIWKVDPTHTSKEQLFEVGLLRDNLAKALRQRLPVNGLPFQDFEFANGERTARFTVMGRNVEVNIDTSEIMNIETLNEDEQAQLNRADGESSSPDGRWLVTVRDHNIQLRSSQDGDAIQLTYSGIEDHPWDLRRIQDTWWSPDNTRFVGMNFDHQKVSPDELPMARRWAGSGRTNEKTITGVAIVDVTSKAVTPLNLVRDSKWVYAILGWRDSDLLFYRRTRIGDEFDLMGANTATGEVQRLISDSVSFWSGDRLTRVDDETFLWTSERSGWNHLYLYDWQGNIIRQLTSGEFPVDRVIEVDAAEGWVYFTAHAEQQQPYRTQLFRVRLDGTDLKLLAENTGQYFVNTWQRIQFSPSKKYFTYNHSTPAQPSVVELKRADGTPLLQLSEVALEGLNQFHWSPPEEFTVKAADGETDLYGLLYKPYDFNPTQAYPVIDWIYGGSHISLMERHSTFEPQWGYSSFEPTWGTGQRTQGLANMGFIVVVLDSRGTPGRSKQFWNVGKRALREYVIPDHVTALKQLADARSYIDINRTGIFGPSAGGNSTILAMLTAPDLFRVGISWDFGFGGEDDPLLLKLAGNLNGKLLLIYGPQRESNERMARALINANKFFDALPMPGADHSLGDADGRYVDEAIRRYFCEHLK